MTLKREAADSYHKQIIEIGDTNITSLNEYLNFYEGYLSDEPDTSIVKGMVLDGSFYGTIQTQKDGKFFLEPAKKYNQSHEGIIYHENDINLNHSYFQQIFSSGILGESFTSKPAILNYQSTDCDSDNKSNHDLLSKRIKIEADDTMVCLLLSNNYMILLIL